MRRLREIAWALTLYAASWTACFLAVVGWHPELAKQYFVLGWSQGGLEVVSLVWLWSLALFALLLVTFGIGRKVLRARHAVVQQSLKRAPAGVSWKPIGAAAPLNSVVGAHGSFRCKR
jgi:hypothetical protein